MQQHNWRQDHAKGRIENEPCGDINWGRTIWPELNWDGLMRKAWGGFQETVLGLRGGRGDSKWWRGQQDNSMIWGGVWVLPMTWLRLI